MQSDMGKLFIGGISWDTTEERLKEYFGGYGEILEAVIMKDRSTGRARGFGFVVFSDPAVAERVIKDKHNIDGRMVEAKRAVPRDDNSSVISRSSSSIQGSPGPLRTKKIFVGGLASTVTESDFKNYFEQFGTITDAVVMYDHNTQRPRGFGFITYDSEDAVDKVLFKTFHELHGKMVEVKRAVPKELSSPSRSSFIGYNYGVNKINDLLIGYTQGGYSPNSFGGYGLRSDSPITGVRNAFGPLGNNFGMGLNMNFEPGLNPNFGRSPNFNGGVNYGRGMSPHYIGSSNRLENSIGYENVIGGDTSFFSSGARNLWGNGGINNGINSSTSSAYIGSSGSNSGVNWGPTRISPQRGPGNISSPLGNLGYGGGDASYGLGGGGGGYGRDIIASGPLSSSFAQPNSGYDRGFSEIYGGGSVSREPTWHLANSEREGSGSFGYGLGSGVPDVLGETSPRFVGGYNMIGDR